MPARFVQRWIPALVLSSVMDISAAQIASEVRLTPAIPAETKKEKTPTRSLTLIERARHTPPAENVRLATRVFKTNPDQLREALKTKGFHTQIHLIEAELAASNRSASPSAARGNGDRSIPPNALVQHDLQSYLAAQGIRFPPPSFEAAPRDQSEVKTLHYNYRDGALVIRATAAELDQIEKLLRDLTNPQSRAD